MIGSRLGALRARAMYNDDRYEWDIVRVQYTYISISQNKQQTTKISLN